MYIYIYIYLMRLLRSSLLHGIEGVSSQLTTDAGGTIHVELKRGSVPFGVRFLGTIMFFFFQGRRGPMNSKLPLDIRLIF